MKISFSGILIIVSIIISLNSCNTEKATLPNSIGKSSEILVVTNNKVQWNSVIGDTLVNYFYRLVEGLPQPEPMFTLVHIPQEAFTSVYERNCNLLIVDINKEFEKPLIETKMDLWAKPQRVIKITAPSTESFLEEFEKRKETFLELFLRIERKRTLTAFKSAEDAKIVQELKNNLGIYMTIPAGFRVAKETKNFMWIRKEPLTYSQGIMIYEYDYTDTIAFDPDYILGRRNKMTRAYIPGPSDSSYMTISKEFIQPVFKEVNFLDHYAIETRGLWEVENDFMGGPFLSYTFVDEKDQKVVTLDGYVYAPNEDKRDLLRELVAIFHSFRFVDEGE